ncbi:hypothetical protein [Psychrobium sp. 1_MG-2023]|uniref:hypothetical protein n=1 Tax=Psychrobium sp. 1_MG-2023 TaxID=3062624 RepID=UPI0026D7567A|nr:hypothetical protein [Psychrobium sp. 1_MG-2023]MDP2560300.1 hypothetical protein [Psychrobium sp. 1_MG-2023]
MFFLSSSAQSVAQEQSAVLSIKPVEMACKELSQETLEEMGISLLSWRSERFNSDGSFNIEGYWRTKQGNYIVECELPFGQSIDLISYKLIRENVAEH